MRRVKEIVVLIFVLIGLTYGLTILLEKDQDLARFNVLIETEIPTPFGMVYSIGSGVVISKDGNIITARHVLEGASNVRVTLYDGRSFDVNDFYMDINADIGVIDLPCDINDFIFLANSDEVLDGSSIIHVGNPLGIMVGVQYKGNVEKTHFRRLFAGKDLDLLLLNLNIESGCSGGGLYFKGGLVGILTMGNDDISIAIASNECKKVLERYARRTSSCVQ